MTTGPSCACTSTSGVMAAITLSSGPGTICTELMSESADEDEEVVDAVSEIVTEEGEALQLVVELGINME